MIEISIKTEITEVDIILVRPQKGLVGFCSFVINGQIYVGNVAIYKKLDGGHRLLYPTRKLITGKRLTTVHPITKEAGQKIKDAVLGRLKQIMEKEKKR